MNQKSSTLEIIVASFILCTSSLSLYYVYQKNYAHVQGEIWIKAEFDSVGGLTIGSPVKINGVSVGSVKAMDIDPEKNFTVLVTFSVQKHILLPEDTEASIINESLLGQPILTLSPGSQEALLSADDVIYRTTPPANITDLMSRFLFSSKSEEIKPEERPEEGKSLENKEKNLNSMLNLSYFYKSNQKTFL